MADETKERICFNCKWAVECCDGGKIECHKNAPYATTKGNMLAPYFPVLETNNYCGEWVDNEGE